MYMITRYKSDDGSEHLTAYDAIKQDAALKGLHHQCPKCKGEATINGKPKIQQVEDREATAAMGFFASTQFKDEIVGYEKIPCDVCKGLGWTAEPKRPIVKTTVVGYE